MPPTEVTSRQHPFVKRCRAVAAGREDGTLVLLDGEHLLADALSAGVSIVGILTDGRPRGVLRVAESRGVPLFVGPADLVESASPVRSASGIVALAAWSPQPATALLQAPAPMLVGLVGVQDPGNVGAIIRSADALGASGVLALDGSATPAGWKALRGAMGSTFRLPIACSTLATVLPEAQRRGIRVGALVASGGTPMDQVTLARPLLLLAGSEGGGLPPAVVDEADVRVTIPMRSGVESINVGVSVALVLWEARKTAPLR